MKIVIPVLLALVLGACLYIFYMQSKTDKKVKDLNDAVNDRRKFDSLRTVIETQLYDSLSGELERRDTRIKNLESEQSKIRKQNAQLQKSYDAISVFMPEF